VSEDVLALLRQCRLIAIPKPPPQGSAKKTGGVRPLAIGAVATRIAAIVALKTATSNIRAQFAPTQFAIEDAGCER
jgi:hypothetical protein